MRPLGVSGQIGLRSTPCSSAPTCRSRPPDGLSLVPYTGPALTVEGELNKIASNVATGRNIAGVHWRSDYTESLPFGEAIAIGLLQEMSLGFNEDDGFFELTKFEGGESEIRYTAAPEHLNTFGDHTPKELWDQYHALVKRLG